MPAGSPIAQVAEESGELGDGSRNNDSTVQPRAAASASAAAVDATSRPISIALTPARESPARRASAACDEPRRARYARTSLFSFVSGAMIVPCSGSIVPRGGFLYDHGS